MIPYTHQLMHLNFPILKMFVTLRISSALTIASSYQRYPTGDQIK